MKKKLAIAVFVAFLAAVWFIPAADPASRRFVVDLSKQGSASAPPKLTPEQTEAIKKRQHGSVLVGESGQKSERLLPSVG